jgi:hypothetical protein
VAKASFSTDRAGAGKSAGDATTVVSKTGTDPEEEDDVQLPAFKKPATTAARGGHDPLMSAVRGSTFLLCQAHAHVHVKCDDSFQTHLGACLLWYCESSVHQPLFLLSGSAQRQTMNVFWPADRHKQSRSPRLLYSLQ